jgi:hypothetical protein
MSTPMGLIFSRCCALALSGHVAAAPPIAPRNSRRRMSALSFRRSRRPHRTGSNNSFDRGNKRLRDRNMGFCPMSGVGQSPLSERAIFETAAKRFETVIFPA